MSIVSQFSDSGKSNNQCPCCEQPFNKMHASKFKYKTEKAMFINVTDAFIDKNSCAQNIYIYIETSDTKSATN